MAIVLDDKQYKTVSAAATLTQSMTLAGDNSMLIILAWLIDTGSGASATWNGVNMTVAAHAHDTVLGGLTTAYLFYLANPDLGTHDAVISTNNGNKDIYFYGANFNGLLAAAPETTQFSEGSGTSITNALTTTADNAMHVSLFQSGSLTVGLTPGAGTQAVILLASGKSGLFASNPYAVTPAGLNTLAATADSTGAWVALGASFTPAVTFVPKVIFI